MNHSTGLHADINVLLPEVGRCLELNLPAGCPELSEILAAILDPAPPAVIALPIACCTAVGGQPAAAIQGAAAWSALNLFVRLMDDLEDQDQPEGWWKRLGLGRTHHCAAMFREISMRILLDLPLDQSIKLGLLDDLNLTLLQAGVAQAKDLASSAADTGEAWQILEGKSGQLFSFACRMGGILGGADHQKSKLLSEFGLHLGTALQLLEDWASCSSNGRDLKSRKKTFPLYAAHSLATENIREELSVALQMKISDSGRLDTLLEKTGGRAFTLWAAQQERKKATDCVSQLGDQAEALLYPFYTEPFVNL